MHLNLPFFACIHFLVSHILAQNVYPLDEICNLIDPSHINMEGNDCPIDETNELHQVSQQSFHFIDLRCFQFQVNFHHTVEVQNVHTPMSSPLHTQDIIHHKVPILTPEQGCRKVTDDGMDVANDDSDDDREL
jgi:hypothetical protein